MILKAVPQKKKDEFDLIGDIRKIVQSDQTPGNDFYVHQFPVLPERFKKVYQSKSEKVDLYNFNCTCQQFNDNSKLYQGRDIRRACKHIYYKATQTWLKDFVPELTLLFLKIAVFNRYQFLYRKDIYKRDVYYIISPGSAWVKILAQNNAAMFVEYTYHTIKKRWGYSNLPEMDIYIVDQLQKIIKDQFPVEHPYKVFSELEKL